MASREEEFFKESVKLFNHIELIMDKYSILILLGTAAQALTEDVISKKYKIPEKACSERLRLLERVNLVKSQDKFYTSCVEIVSFTFDKGKLTLRLKTDKLDYLRDIELEHLLYNKLPSFTFQRTKGSAISKILTVLTTKLPVRVLLLTSKKPRTTNEIVTLCKIPQTTAYLLLKDMEKFGLVEKKEKISTGRRRATVFQPLTSAHFMLLKDKLWLDIRLFGRDLDSTFRLDEIVENL